MTPYQFTEVTTTEGVKMIINLAQIKFINKMSDGDIRVCFGEASCCIYLSASEGGKIFDELGFYL